MGKLKQTIKKLVPASIIGFITGFFYGWRGNYSSWDEAKKKSGGYDAKNILETVSKATLKVKNGEAVFERDSVLFDKVDYSYPLLTSLLWVSAQNKGKLHVLDFGGALGSTYFQNKTLLNKIPDVKWCIVEQKNYVEEGKKKFQDETLQFYSNIPNCLEENQIDLVLLSSVIQYIEKPYQLLKEIIETGIKYIIVDRTPFINKKEDRITIQKVHPAIYKASYPCWFFSKNKFMSFFEADYDIILDFDALDKANFKSEFKGFLLNNQYISQNGKV